ncbi:MAG: carbon-nitrogen hydrolase family protein [Actinomycetota bacterium]
MTDQKVVVASVQGTPVFLDRGATVEHAADLTAKAAADGARLVVFPETFVPTYPDWIWRTKPWSHSDWFARLQDQSVVVPSLTTNRLSEIAKDQSVYLVMGVNERELHGATLYNTLLYFGPNGELIGKHRKLMPTGAERLVGGMGDGSTLEVFDTSLGRIGGLICWENYMPLTRYALYAQGIEIYVAPTWDNSDVWVPTLQHVAKEGRMFVIGSTPCLRGSDVPDSLPGRDDVYEGDEDWMSRGNSVIIDPWGEILAGPLVGSEGIVQAEIDVDDARRAKLEFDPVGHYSRPDVFELHVDSSRRLPVLDPPPA